VRPGLLHPSEDPSLDGPAPLERRGVIEDLGLDVLIDAMAHGDGRVADAVRHVLLDPVADPDVIVYRQSVLRACLARPHVVRELYAVATRTLERRRKVFWGLVRRPAAVLHNGIELMHLYQAAFRELRAIADAFDGEPVDDGLADLLARLRADLHDDFLAEIDGHLMALRFQAGVRVNARLDAANPGTTYVLEPPAALRSPRVPGFARWWRSAWRGLLRRDAQRYTIRIASHDDGGARDLAELQGRGLQRTANAVAEACDELLWFFRRLQGETAFYVGGLELHTRLTAIGAPVVFPRVAASSTAALNAAGLYDPGLALTLARPVVGNDLEADGANLIVVTGANQGGKTTFLRSLGSAQLLLQSGLFVAAQSFRASVATDLFTHFTRAEDAGLRRGRLDEELSRLDAIATKVCPGATVLLNESFASTNEREGSELAAGVVRALTEAGIRVVFVTHLNRFVRDVHGRPPVPTRFLQAQRLADGTRTFRMIAGEPARASHGVELFRTIFGPSAGTEVAATAGDD
jgi:hypothetical protein